MKKSLRVLGLILALMAAVFMTASAQTEGLFPESISIDVEELNLQVGEGYTYAVTILPEKTAFKDYSVYVSDPFAVEVDIENSLIAALAPGTAYLYFDTVNHSAHAIVKVTVGEGAELDAKAAWGISEEDLAKVRSESLKSFLVFLNESMAANSVDLSTRSYSLLAKVKDGTEEAQAAYAGECGLTDLSVLDLIDTIVINGSVDAVINYITANDDLISVRDNEIVYLTDPEPEESDLEAKAVTLEGNFELITTVSAIHNLGYTGKGTTVAVIDTGIAAEHPEFTGKTEGKVVKQHCFGSTADLGYTITRDSVCENHAAESDSAFPSGATNPAAFTHGTAVAGAAAGKGGVAPSADIIAVAAFTDVYFEATADECKELEKNGFEYDAATGRCYASGLNDSEELKAYQWLLDLVDGGQRIDAVNLSYGGADPKDTDNCDANYPTRTAYFKAFEERGIQIVAAAGNEGKTGLLCSPGCISSVYAVAASYLSDNNELFRAPFSNITAGTNLYAPGMFINLPTFTMENSAPVYSYAKMHGTSFSSPETAGAMLLLHEMFPDNSMLEISHIPAAISTKSITVAVSDTESITVPELDFSTIANYAMTAPNASAEPGGGSLSVTCDDDANADGFEVTAYLNGQAVGSGSAAMDGTVTINGLKGKTEYTLKVRKFVVIDGIRFYSSTQELTAAPQEGPANTITFYELDGARRELPKKLPGTGFSAVKPTALEAKPASVNYSALNMTISIPSENLEAELLSVPYVDGDYPVQWLGSNAGVLEGFEGATFIAGHNHLDDTDYGPFFSLSTIAEGTRVFLTAADGSMKTYEVYANAQFDASDFAGVVEQASEYEDSLALITCEDETIDGGYAHRRVVFARAVRS